jgi:hypothetical protein
MECENCRTPIRGKYHVPGVVDLTGYEPPIPTFCHECGKPYPWTTSRLTAAKELADEFDELDVEERDKLKSSLDDLVRDSPRTEVAATRFKKIAGKLGRSSYEAIKSVATDVLSETAKKLLFGP